MEGNENPAVVFDTGITNRPDFTNDRDRALVNLTRVRVRWWEVGGW